ncbi:hypothetical protein Vafri_455, partial [Volvox africanus]
QPSLRALHGALVAAFAARPAAPLYVTALQAIATRFIDADGVATAPLLLPTADLTAAAAANSGYEATAVLLEAQQSVQEKGLEAHNAAAAATAAAGGSDVYDRSGPMPAAAAKRAANALSTTLEALAHVYIELDEQDVVLAVRRRLLQCPGTFAMLMAEAAGRPRLAVRRAGQLSAALDLLQELGPGVASEPVPERPQDQGLALGSSALQPQQPEGEEEAGGGPPTARVDVPTVATLLGPAVMTRGSAVARVVSPVEQALWRETVASCADALGDWSRLAVELEGPMGDLGVQLPDGGGGGGGGGGLFASGAVVRTVAESFPRLLLPDGRTPADVSACGSSSSGTGAAVLLRRVLRSALFQLSEEDFQMAAALQGGGGADGGSGSAAAAVEAGPSEGPALLVLQLLQQLNDGGGGREVALYAASAAPLELVAAEVYRACWRGSWERCLSVLQASLGRLRARWSGLHSMSSAARISTLTLLQPLAEIQEMVRQLQLSRSRVVAGAGGGSGASRLTATSAASAVQHLKALVNSWRRRGMGFAVATAAAAAAGGGGGAAGRNPTCTGSALNTLLQVRRLLVDAASCILPRTVRGGASADGAVLYRELQCAARSAHVAMRFTAAEAAVHAGCADIAAEALPPPHQPLPEDDIHTAAAARGLGADAHNAARQLRLFRTHADTIVAQAAAEPSDCIVYDAVSELLSGMRPWHKEALRRGLLAGRLAAESELTQSQALLVLSGDPRPEFRKFLSVRVAAALGSAAAAIAFDPPPAVSSQQQQHHHHQVPPFDVLYDHGFGAVGDSDASTAARASAHFALLCGRLMRATHGSVADCALEPATPPLEELLSTPKKKQVASAVRAGGGDLPACIVRHLLRAMALAGSSTTGYGGRSGGGGGGGETLGLHLRLQLPVVLSVLRASVAATEAFRQGWSAVPLGFFLPWVGQVTSMISGGGEGASGGGGSGGGADDPLLGPLTALACTYPQRLYAPLRMMSGGGGGGGGGCVNRISAAALAEVMAPLLAATESPVVSEFIDALEQMTYPAQRWQVFTSRITQALARADIAAAVGVWTQEAWPSLFGRYQPASSVGQPAVAAAAAVGAPIAAAPPISRRQVAGAIPPVEPYNVAFARRYRVTFEEFFGGSDGAGLRQLAERTRQQFDQQQPSPPQQQQPQLQALGRALTRAFLAAATAAGPGNARAGGQRQWEALQAPGARSLEMLCPWFRSYEQAAGDAAAAAAVVSAPENRHVRQRQQLLLLPSMAFATASSAPQAEPGVYGAGLPPLGSDDVAPVTVVGFKRMVTVFTSKQRPKLLTLYCSDLSTRDFVVKGGEDVRLDERILQLYDVMNGLASRDAACARRALKVPVYDVIPLSPTVGMLQFVPGTRPLQDCLVDSPEVSEQEAQAIEQYTDCIRSAAFAQQQQPVATAPLPLPGPREYWQMYARADAASTVRHFKQVVSCLGSGRLRACLLSCSGHNPELFLARRGALSAALAAGSVWGYLAGVGDRHPANLLLQPATGRLVHVDFGYSFGSATQVLPIPELVPFRLTPQLLGALKPHAGREVLTPALTAALAALSAPAARQLLAAVMEIFLREPVADWQHEAMVLRAGAGGGGAGGGTGRSEQSSGGGSGGGGVVDEEFEDSRVLAARLARTRVEIALRKLARLHPSLIMVEELRYRHAATSHFGALCGIVRGDGGGDVVNAIAGSDGGCRDNAGGRTAYRARFNLLERSGPLTPEEQARCLIDLATDYAVLGRMYLGWRPYL